MTDTTTEAVERIAQALDLSASIWVHGASPRQPEMSTTGKAAATLRALAQERDDETLRADTNFEAHEAVMLSLRYAEAERDAARAEVERIKAAWLFVIQIENMCRTSGLPCDAKRCGCAAELEMLLREHDERAALAATEDKQ